MTVHVPRTVCVCPYGRENCPGASLSITESQDGAVVLSAEPRGTCPTVRYTPTTNYILKLYSSSSSTKESPRVRLGLLSGGLSVLNLTSKTGWLA